MILYDYDKAVAQFVGEIAGIADWGPCKAIGVLRRGELVAGAVFSQYKPPNIEVSFASSTPRWASRDAIRAILRYPFMQLECRRVTMTCGAHEVQSREFAERLGFKLEGYHPDAHPIGDIVSYGLLARDAARWIK